MMEEDFFQNFEDFLDWYAELSRSDFDIAEAYQIYFNQELYGVCI